MRPAKALRSQLDQEGVPQVDQGAVYPEGISYKWVPEAMAPGPLRLSLRVGSKRFVLCIDEAGGVDQLLIYRAAPDCGEPYVG